MRIQISQQAHDALSTAKPRFFMHKRGEIEVKVRNCFYIFRHFHLTLTTFVLKIENTDNLYIGLHVVCVCLLHSNKVATCTLTK